MFRHFIPLILVLGGLAIPATAGAAFSSQVSSPTRVTFTGTDSAETLQISLDGALFRHDQPGDPFDFDSTLPGRQSITPADVRTLFTAIGRGGDDRILLLTPEASLSADGGDGNDVVVGSDDRDTLRGGSGDDPVAGRGTTDSIDLGPGDDRYEGTAKAGGNDRVEGREGDDTALVVGTGEADEFNVLGAAISFEVEMLLGGNTQIRDVETLELALSQDNSGVRVEGTAAGKAFAAVGVGDAFVLEARAGDDSATVLPGAARFSTIAVDGGDGADVLRGSEGIEWLAGALGDDVVEGGAGPDHLLAGGGDDLVRTRDRAADTVDCGSGTDLLQADPLDPPGGCEQVQPGLAAGPIALARVTATDILRLDDPGVVEVPVTCSQAARGGCAGRAGRDRRGRAHDETAHDDPKVSYT